jgi:hypothetical protein
MAPFVKVLEIKRVVLGPIERRSIEMSIVDFEFEHKNNAVQQDDRINPLTHSWDRKLDRDPTFSDVAELFLQ